MNASWQRILTVARREFLTTVKRRAFLLTLIGTPAYFAFVTFLSASASLQEKKDALKDLDVLAVIDSSGAFANASREIRTTLKTDLTFSRRSTMKPDSISFRTEVRFYSSLDSALADVRSGKIPQALVIPADYVETGRMRRYTRPGSPFTSGDRRAIGGWLARNLVAGHVGDDVAARAARPSEEEQLFTLDRSGRFEIKDDSREIADFLVPMFFSMLLGLSIMIGGQYLLQGVAEEKESRILESLMCQVSAEELMNHGGEVPYWPTELAQEYRQRQAVRMAGGVPPREGFESVFMHKDGRRFPVLIFEAPLLNAQRAQTGWMSAFIDISEQRRIEELSRASQERLQASARLATVGEMASLLSQPPKL